MKPVDMQAMYDHLTRQFNEWYWDPKRTVDPSAETRALEALMAQRIPPKKLYAVIGREGELPVLLGVFDSLNGAVEAENSRLGKDAPHYCIQNSRGEYRVIEEYELLT